jgi:hypothetical protein
MKVKCPRCGLEKESINCCGATTCPKCKKQFVFSWEIRNSWLRKRRELNPKIRESQKRNALAWRKRNIDRVRQHEREVYHADAEKLRVYFGDLCFICRKQRGNERFELHEKNGEIHRKKPSLELREKDRFVLLCKTCHRSVHWCMEYLNMSWEQISLSRKAW